MKFILRKPKANSKSAASHFLLRHSISSVSPNFLSRCVSGGYCIFESRSWSTVRLYCSKWL